MKPNTEQLVREAWAPAFYEKPEWFEKDLGRCPESMAAMYRIVPAGLGDTGKGFDPAQWDVAGELGNAMNAAAQTCHDAIVKVSGDEDLSDVAKAKRAAEIHNALRDAFAEAGQRAAKRLRDLRDWGSKRLDAARRAQGPAWAAEEQNERSRMLAVLDTTATGSADYVLEVWRQCRDRMSAPSLAAWRDAPKLLMARPGANTQTVGKRAPYQVASQIEAEFAEAWALLEDPRAVIGRAAISHADSQEDAVAMVSATRGSHPSPLGGDWKPPAPPIEQREGESPLQAWSRFGQGATRTAIREGRSPYRRPGGGA